MKIVINENKQNNEETEIIINCYKTDESILKIISSLKSFDSKITGVRNNQTFIISPNEIMYVESVDKKSYIYTKEDVFDSTLRLYELEEKLANNNFIRVSKSVVINLTKIKSLRPDFGGKLLLTMDNGEKMIASRQYANILKIKLGIKGER